jgi:osmoprotectant transport system permease protein
MIDWAWLADHLDAIVLRTVQHVYLTAIALTVGFAISFVLALWVVRRRMLYGPVIGVAGILFTIPSLALFAALVPITGLSVLTAVVPLVLYTLVIFIHNIVTGLEGVPAEVVEAASGMGYSRGQRLWQVELPLAIPLLVAGLRVASVSTIGLVTISALIGDAYGGLGFFITEGIRHSFPTEIYTGAILSMALAVVADLIFVRLQRRITPWSRARAAGSPAPVTPR